MPTIPSPTAAPPWEPRHRSSVSVAAHGRVAALSSVIPVDRSAGAGYDAPVTQKLTPVWIDNAHGVRHVADRIASAGWLALDTEADSYHAYFHKLCLMQVTVDDEHFILDPIALDRTALEPVLCHVEAPECTVLMHGADYDMRVLDRDLHLHPRGLQDTQIMAQLLGEDRTGLATLLANEFDVALDKRYQRADWSRRPLTDEMLAYAAADTAYLEGLADRLQTRLQDSGRWTWAVEEFTSLEQVRFQPPVEDPLAFERIKGARQLKNTARDRLYTLHQWRDEEARRRNVSPFRVLSNGALVNLATSPPHDRTQLKTIRGIGNATTQRYGKRLLGLLTHPKEAPQRQRPTSNNVLTSSQRRRVKVLRAARDQLAERLHLDPGVLCPKSALEAIVRRSRPVSNQSDLKACGIDGWRLDVVGPTLLETVAGDGSST